MPRPVHAASRRLRSHRAIAAAGTAAAPGPRRATLAQQRLTPGWNIRARH
jgi:hypothetical protein